MFRGRMTEHSVRTASEVDDGLGFKGMQYSEPTTVLMYLTTPTQTEFNQNEFYMSRYAATALTYDKVEKDSLIDDVWRVDSVTQLKNERVLGLNRFGDE